MEERYDVTIIGGGPAGMFAAFYCGLHQLKAQCTEALPQLGGQPAALYPEKRVWDVAGRAGVTGQELADDLAAQIEVAPVDQFLGEKVTDVVKEDDGSFTIHSAKRKSTSKSIGLRDGMQLLRVPASWLCPAPKNWRASSTLLCQPQGRL